MDVQSMYKMWGPNLIPPGMSSLGTWYFSRLLARYQRFFSERTYR